MIKKPLVSCVLILPLCAAALVAGSAARQTMVKDRLAQVSDDEVFDPDAGVTGGSGSSDGGGYLKEDTGKGGAPSPAEKKTKHG